MSIVGTLIDKARARSGITSDSALAATFGVHRQAVSKWRTGDAYPDEEHIAEMALMAGDDPVQWLVAIKAVRSDGAAGKAWSALAKRLAAAAVSLLMGVLIALPLHADAATKGFERSPYALCEIKVAPNAAAANATRSYASALRYWTGWHAARYGIELTLPVLEAAVLQFVVDHMVRRTADGELAW